MMQKIEILLLFLKLVIFQSNGQGQNNDDECVRLWLQKRPDLLGRFDRNQVKWLCQRTDEWMQAAVTPVRPVSDFITPKQMEYLTKLQCQGADCIKEIKHKKLKDEKPPPPGWVPSLIGGKKGPGQGPGSSHSDALADTDAFDGVDENSILSQDPDGCQERFWLARTCKFLINVTSVEEAFPEEFNRPKIATNLQRKMQERLANRKSKCQRIRSLLQSRSKSLDDVPNCDGSVVLMTPKQFADRCNEILEYEKSHRSSLASAWNFVKKLVGRGRVDEDEKTYAEWLDRCRQARDRLQGKGMTFQTWLKQFTEKIMPGRRKRASTPSEAVNVMHNDFADLLTENPKEQRAKRKEYRMLTDDERKRYHAAINKLKTDKIDTLSKYDLLVVYHTPQEASGAHWGPAFLPFHREFLKQYEIALRKEEPTIALPYWDTTLDEGLPTPRDSIIWTKDFLGNPEGAVVQGPFANWSATQELSLVPGVRQLYRSVGTSPFGGLYKASDLEFIITREKFEDLTACVDPTFELVHGIVHMFVGGYMADIGIAPNDPAFFMHHNFIDYQWEEFRQAKQTLEQRETNYPTDDKACNNFHYAESQMKPFSIRNIDGLSNNYTKDIYFYQPRPRCSETAPNCGSTYLFCDAKNARCLSKVQVTGNCTGFETVDICYNSVCKNGICTADPTAAPATTVAVPTTPGTTTVQVTTTTTTKPTTTLTKVTTATTPKLTTTTASTTNPVPSTTAAPTTNAPTVPPATTPKPPVTTPRPVVTTRPPVMTTKRVISIITDSVPPLTTKKPTTVAPTTPRTTQAPTSTRPPTTPAPVTTRPPMTPAPTTTRPSTPIPTTGPSVQTTAPSFPVTYFTVTVVRGQGYYAQPVKNAQVKTTGLNMPRGYTQSLTGVMMPDAAYPSYSGACLARVYDPSRLGAYANIVQFTIEAVDDSGRACRIQCYNQQSKRYGDCPQANRFKISPNQYVSDPIKYSNVEKEALEKMWTVSGYRQKTPDYIMFQCP